MARSPGNDGGHAWRPWDLHQVSQRLENEYGETL
jgi:hypothetical protein